MSKLIILTLLIILSGCSLQPISNSDLVHKISHQPINEEHILSAHYCNMGFMNPDIKKYKYYDGEENRLKPLDVYIPEKCVLIRTSDKLIFLPREGSNILTPELLTINKSKIAAIGLWKKGTGGQIQLKLKDRTLVIELLKNTIGQDAASAAELFEDIRGFGAEGFKIKVLAIPPRPPLILFHW